jgi:broad specificity phosphatase PhoE
MHLILVRHGETDFNRDSVALGRADVPLNDRGRRQAEALGRALAPEPLAAVYSSPLRRAADTAAAVASHHALAVQTESALIEMDVGEIDGIPLADVGARYPELLPEWMSERGPEYTMPGGERLVDVAARSWEFLQELQATHEKQSVAVVTHNFVILSALAQALGLPLHEFRRVRHAVAAVSRLTLRGDRVDVVAVNDTCHLAGIE